MAAIQIKNGQLVAASASETEIQFPKGVTDVLFFLATGAAGVQITTGAKGGQAVIGGSINSFVAADRGVMRVETSDGSASEGRSIFIKGSGGVVFMW